ncbi:MAG TPA: hypothetical protein PKL73_07215 [Polyangiaceae bacterium]|nr:MAG: hypothetical protein BWY17_04744 [Deltaproteobacteria bacterium ADurb.Bin207]HNS96725.1 hypothetical protein [Polyangiaceae bacterium]HNZ22434.1 hypothetical protein [Polyangiaceae bacterium]HOD20969.1 hypothetical protein [Polyangiaceae bacterium]HOE48328.1 hypothetical protein [Polyangiaceae bacterium]
MFRRFRLAALTSATVFALGAVSITAVAAPKDAAAKKIDQDTMNNDFVMADFRKAEANLKKALDTCGDSGCSPAVKAQILVNLGIVQSSLGNDTEAEETFVQAIRLHGAVVPDADFVTPEIQKAFDAAKARASSGDTGSVTVDVPPTSDGEVGHEPVSEQMVNTPVPIWVSVPEGMPVGKIIVRYKPFGGSWKKLNLTKKRNGWGGNIDCNDVTTTGALKYYISVLDNAGDPITSLGSLNKPFETKIKNQLDGDPPRLPNEPPPARCAAKEDCPPGLPGCPAVGARGDKGWGSSCEATRECKEGLICLNGMCEEGEEDTSSGGSSANYAKNWVGLFVSMDLAYVTGDDVCGRDSQANKGYACFTTGGDGGNPYEDAGTHYHGEPIPSGNGNAIAGGLAPATIRFMASFDRVILDNIMVGGRAGFAIRGGPQPDGGKAFLPLHLEARGSYWFGQDPFSRVGFRPYAFLGGGMAQVDTKVDVSVREAQTCPATGCTVSSDPKDPNSVIQRNPQTQKVEAWRKAGQGFVGLGGGVMYALSANSGVVGELKIAYMLPTPNIVIAPTIGYAMGF